MARFVEKTPNGDGWQTGAYRFFPASDGSLSMEVGGNLYGIGFDRLPSAVQSVTYGNGGTSTIDANTGNNAFFTLVANGSSTTIAVSNVPATDRYGLELHLTWTSGAITFPASWSKGDNLPSQTGNYVITAVTVDGGTSFKIAVLTE